MYCASLNVDLILLLLIINIMNWAFAQWQADIATLQSI